MRRYVLPGKYGNKAPFCDQKSNRIVKLYCVFDNVQCWCALFPPPPPAASGTISPQSLPPTPAWPWTCPDSTRKYKSPLSSINWGNIMGEWTEISFFKEQIDKSFAMIANAGSCCNLLWFFSHLWLKLWGWEHQNKFIVICLCLCRMA